MRPRITSENGASPPPSFYFLGGEGALPPGGRVWRQKWGGWGGPSGVYCIVEFADPAKWHTHSAKSFIVFYKKSSEKGYIFGTLLGCIVLSNLQILQNGTPILQSPSLSFIRKVVKKATFSAHFWGVLYCRICRSCKMAHPFCKVLHCLL